MKRMDAVPDLAGSGKKAIEKLKAGHYDIVFMDHMMPEMDGIETLREINKQSLIDDSTVVIALTANAISGAKEMYISEGFRDYLSKPIVPEELENMLAEYLPSGTYSFENADTSKVSDAGVNKDTNTTDDTEITQDVGTGNMDEMLDKLTEKGFNVKAALTYSMNDADFYKDLLETYVKSSAEKKSALKEFYEDKKWDDYRVQVHALKSASRTIGADSLADKAFVQEKASKAYEEKMIYEGFDEMMSEYSEVVEELKTILGMDDADIDSFSDKEDESDDMEVLEFLPEQEE
jgi:CheY-like chemotaxis protein/HPt (histidine-containing phosphotransfer) domain-containing protein